MFNTPDHLITKIAARQHGVVSRQQAIQAGLSRFAISRRLAAGQLTVVFPGVFAISGVPASPPQRFMAACLWAGDGAVASHRTAASLMGDRRFCLCAGGNFNRRTANATTKGREL